MPKWLQGMLALSAGIVIVFALIGSLALWAQIQGKAQPPFDVDQRAYLNTTYPNGTYVSDSVYRWCEGREFTYTDPSTRTWSLRETCLDMPRHR